MSTKQKPGTPDNETKVKSKSRHMRLERQMKANLKKRKDQAKARTGNNNG